MYISFDFLDLVLSPSVEGNKVPANESAAAAVKIQVRRKEIYFQIFFFIF